MISVLIADDLDVSRRRLSLILSGQGYRVLEADDGDEALRILRAERPDVAIVDLLMPAMDGFEFVREVRTEPGLSGTPVIFFSAHFPAGDARALAEALGVRHVLTKSCPPGKILEAVRDAASGPAAPAAAVVASEFNREHSRLISSKLSAQARGFVEALGSYLRDDTGPGPGNETAVGG